MRTTLFLQLLLLVTTASAGGYQGAVERLWLYFAYQIDGINDPADRSLGFGCKKWDGPLKQCKPLKDPKNPDDPPKPIWEECKGKVLPSKRCTFNELNAFLGKMRDNEQLVGGKDKDGKPLPQDTTNPGIEETAKNVYTKFMASNQKTVYSFPPYKFLYDGTKDYNDFINRVTAVVTKTAASKKTKENQFLFDGFKASLDAIKDARVGDHGPYLIKAAEAELKAKGITVEKTFVGKGKNPGTGDVWETVDWEKTVSNAVAAGKEESKVLEAISDFQKDFYVTGSEAHKHKVVMESYKLVGDTISSC